MRNLVVSILGVPLLLLCAAPALAQSAASPDKEGAVQTVIVRPPSAERETYLQKTRDELSIWRDRLDAFGADAKRTTLAAGSDADRDLHSAWADVQTAYLKLQSVGADGWTDAKASYESASDRLAAAWHRVHS